jgi:hypothetical protein
VKRVELISEKNQLKDSLRYHVSDGPEVSRPLSCQERGIEENNLVQTFGPDAVNSSPVTNHPRTASYIQSDAVRSRKVARFSWYGL